MEKKLLKEVSYLSLNDRGAKVVLEESTNSSYTTSVGILKRIPISRYTRNTNNRIYPRKLWERVLRLYEVEGMPALADHPPDDNIEGSVKDTVGVWHNIKLDNDCLYGDLVLIGDIGKKIVEILNAGGKIGVSTVGYGVVNEDGTVDAESYELIRIGDIVLVPSQKTYFDKSNYVPPPPPSNENMVQDIQKSPAQTPAASPSPPRYLGESVNMRALNFILRETKNRLKKDNPFLLLESKFTLFSYLNEETKHEIEPLLDEIDKKLEKLEKTALITDNISFSDYKKSLDSLLEQYRVQNVELRNKIVDLLNEKANLVKHLESSYKEVQSLKESLKSKDRESSQSTDINPLVAISYVKEYIQNKNLSNKDILNLFEIKGVYSESDVKNLLERAKYLLEKYKVLNSSLKEEIMHLKHHNTNTKNNKGIKESVKTYIVEGKSSLLKLLQNIRDGVLKKPVLISISDSDLRNSVNKYIRLVPSENNTVIMEFLIENASDKFLRTIDREEVNVNNIKEYYPKILKFFGLDSKLKESSLEGNLYSKSGQAYSNEDLEGNLYKFDDEKDINEDLNHPLRNNEVIPTDGAEQSVIISPSQQVVIRNKYRYSYVDPEDVKIKGAFTQTYGAILEAEAEKIKKLYLQRVRKNPKLKMFEKFILNSSSIVEAVKKIEYFEQKLRDTIIKRQKTIINENEHYWLSNRL